MNRISLCLALLATLVPMSRAAAQARDYMNEGNMLLGEGRADEAAVVFREAIEADPAQAAVYRSQLALSLMESGALASAEVVLVELLEDVPNFPAGLWYYALCSHGRGDYREAVARFERALPHLSASGALGQVYSAHFYIAHSYHELLRREGLSYEEVDAMLEAYEQYILLAPADGETETYRAVVDRLRSQRPSPNVRRWVHID